MFNKAQNDGSIGDDWSYNPHDMEVLLQSWKQPGHQEVARESSGDARHDIPPPYEIFTGDCS
ncbi:hypothetical protein E4U52_001097 [Claviceps spartinae]|nr:hypothetical protein E4U52_001097 [Claviceps spartinae]